MSRFPQYQYFDPKFIQEITDNEDDIVLEIVTVFLETNSANIAELGIGIGNNDPAKVHFAAHKLLGAFNLIGATQLAALTRRAELNSDRKVLEEILAEINNITVALDEELKDFMMRLATPEA